MWRKGLSLLLIFICILSCKRVKHDIVECTEPSVTIADLSEEAEQWSDSVLQTLSLRQKVAQIFMPAIYATSDYWTLRQATEYADSCLGGIILLKGDIEGARLIADTVSRLAGVPPFVAIDAEWGLAMRLVDAPEFPPNSKISEGVDDQLMYDYGYELARECRLLGINMVLGPVVDVSSPGSFMKRRSLGEDPKRVADLALAYARGLEDGDVVSVAKHFPGHGSVSVDSHKQKGVIERSLNEMDSIDIYPFRQWIAQNLSGIMVGHLAVPSIDPDMKPAAVSEPVINDLLRHDLGFKGLVLTDALNMKGAEGYRASDAIAAGADIVLAPLNTTDEIEDVVRAILTGILDEKTLDSRVRKILFYKYLFGIGHRSARNNRDIPMTLPQTDTISRRLAGEK